MQLSRKFYHNLNRVNLIGPRTVFISVELVSGEFGNFRKTLQGKSDRKSFKDYFKVIFDAPNSVNNPKKPSKTKVKTRFCPNRIFFVNLTFNNLK